MLLRNYYEVLGVDPKADELEIRKAYLAVSRKHHPDKNLDDPKGAMARFVECGQAYEILSDPKKRAEYDQLLSFIKHNYESDNGSRPSKSTFDTYYDKFEETANMSPEEALTITAVVGVAAYAMYRIFIKKG